MKVIFMGTPDFSVGTLEALAEAGHEVVLAVTQPDKPKGRGGKMQYTPVKEAALARDIPVYQPKKIREPECIEELKKYNDEDIFVIGGESIYRQLLPYCKTAYITKIDHAYQADTFFPDLDQDPQWQMTKISDEQTYFDLEYVFTIYERVS